MNEETRADAASRLREVALVFLRMGLTAFGGPAAHVALMEAELVKRRGWLTHDRFLDLFGAANLIPGPSSTELAIFLGFERAGWPGLVVAGACFILPAALLVGAIAAAYVRFGAHPEAGALLYGIKPVVIAVLVQALWGLAPKALKSRWLAVLGCLACVAAVLDVNAVAVLAGSGALAMGLRWRDARDARAPGVLVGAFAGGAATAGASVGLVPLFLVFLKIGALVFGSGYVLLAFLRADLVERLHWLTEAQLVDAVAVGQVTPGPVFTTATFIGYLVGGAPGACVATVAIFLPGFALVAATRPLVDRLRRSTVAGGFLDGVNVAALALMAVVGAKLARVAVVNAPTAAVAAVSAALLFRFKVNTTWLIAGGAIVGLVARAR